MRDTARTIFLQSSRLLYEFIARPLVFSQSAQSAHEQALRLCAWFDQHPALLKLLHQSAFAYQPLTIGGVTLEFPLILAAGFVKGMGFENESDACEAVANGVNIIPGWRSIPALVGAVEFGSFTRYPRMGNAGTVIWRDAKTHSTQNRVGLKNPGVLAASEFLAIHRDTLPAIYGINVAVSPGVLDLEHEVQEILETIEAFIDRNLNPAWFTLNLSCPNTDDDPRGNQTEEKARILCSEAVNMLDDTPLWVKISPDLAQSQYQALMRVFADVGVRAVIATNTLAYPSPNDAGLSAGVGGGSLHPHSLTAAKTLMREKNVHDYPVDVIGCGGVLDGATFDAYRQVGISAVQYWSALVYRGPFAAALIADEYRELERA